MKRVFADTSYFIALFQQNDEAHQAALSLSQDSRRLLTSEWVICEIANFFSRSDLRVLVEGLINEIGQTSDVVQADHDSFEAGLGLFRRRFDKNWSLTDCISFNIMRELDITDALTTDHHFEQAGFQVLLK